MLLDTRNLGLSQKDIYKLEYYMECLAKITVVDNHNPKSWVELSLWIAKSTDMILDKKQLDFAYELYKALLIVITKESKET